MSGVSRRSFLQGVAAAGAASALGLRQAHADTRPPNVVVIITDDQGYPDLGCHGNPVLETPHIDRLHAQSTRLTRFHVSPVCSPTRASLMTGRYNYRTGVVDTYIGRSMMHADEVTLAEVLGKAGYATGIFGKWHLGDNYPLRAMDQGFAESLTHNGGGIGQPSDPPGNAYTDPVLSRNGEQAVHPGYCSDIFTTAAIEFVQANAARPFFAYLSFNAPHTPLQVPERYAQKYRDKGVAPDDLAKYYGMIDNIDENVGRVLDALEALALRDNTLVVFMTDNGQQRHGEEHFAAGLRGQKGTVYEGGLRVPCFLQWPGVLEAGRDVDALSAHIDLMPTLAAACGASVPGDRVIDGINLLPLLRDRVDSIPDRTLFFQWHRGDAPEPFRASAVLTQQYKLVDGTALFDLHEDPGETTDISAEHPGRVAELRAAYERWFADVSATRGYDPPRIHIGTPHENPVTLTRQDWRGPDASWASDGLGHWEIEVAAAREYRLRADFAPAQEGETLVLRVGTVERRASLEAGATEHLLEGVALPAGPARLEAWLQHGDSRRGVQYAHAGH